MYLKKPTAESVRELTIPRQESGKGKNRFKSQPLGKGDQEKNPHKSIQLSYLVMF